MAPLPDTQAARAAILTRLRAAAPRQAPPAPDLAPYRAGPHGRGSVGERPDPRSLVPMFDAALRQWRAELHHATPANWPAIVSQVLQAHGAVRVAIGAASPLAPGLDEALAGLQPCRFDRPLSDWKAEFFDTIDAGLTHCDAGIADTGSLLLRPGPHEPRSLSLVPPLHVAVLPLSRLHASLPAALRALDPQADMPTNLLLVSGPSKTADIQQTLAYGAHGPKALAVVLVDDLP